MCFVVDDGSRRNRKCHGRNATAQLAIDCEFGKHFVIQRVKIAQVLTSEYLV